MNATQVSLLPGAVDISVALNRIHCLICAGNPFISIVNCNACSNAHYPQHAVRVGLSKMKAMMIEKMFGEEIKDREPEPSPLGSI